MRALRWLLRNSLLLCLLVSFALALIATFLAYCIENLLGDDE